MPGTAVFIGTTDARKDAKYNESRPLKNEKIPLISNTMASKSTPAGFSVSILLQDNISIFNKYT
jgi:hypothetical protein